MFSRKSNQNTCPLPDAYQRWMDDAFVWLRDEFGREQVENVKVLLPHYSDFPIRYNGDKGTAWETMRIVAGNMEVDAGNILLDWYKEGPSGIDSGSVMGSPLYMAPDRNAETSAGLYWGIQDDGKYHIWLEDSLLGEPEKMVATLTHEIAHIKLLGEGRMTETDERLTDLTALIFGLGIFMANAAFQFYQNSQAWGYSKLGSLTQMEWGYALALFALARNEPEPDWADHLTRNVRSDFEKCIYYLQQRSL